MAKTLPPIAVFGIKGRWGVDNPYECPPNQVIEALNVDWFKSSLCRKRGGATDVSLTGGTAQSGVVSAIFSHVPSETLSSRELWSIDDAATPRFKRLAGGTAWANVTLVDNVASRSVDITAVSFNGKLYFAYDSTVNRLHVWDPTDAKVRRVGLDTPAAPTVANTGAGSYAATIRYYKMVFVVKVSGVIVRRSEASAAVSFTPSGTGTHARITKAASISEDETHWILYASPDDANYVQIADTAVGTTTFDDNTTPSLYSGTAIPVAGTFTCPPSAKYLAPDDARILMAGAWETSAGNAMVPSSRRIWWTGTFGATDTGDDERVSNTSLIKNYADIEEAVNGLAGPLYGSMYAFSFNSHWKFVGTGVPTAPYLKFRVVKSKGLLHHKSIVMAEDEAGRPAMYWWSPQGPYRAGEMGQQNLSEDVADIVRDMNLGATSIPVHGVYHEDKKQIWWWIATGVSNDPDVRVVYDCRLGRIVDAGAVRRGWAKHTGESCEARCSAMMSNTLGATMSMDLKPYIGRSSSTAIWKCDSSATDDAGTAFQAYIMTRPYTPWGMGFIGGTIEDATLAAEVGAGVTISLTAIVDFGYHSVEIKTVSLASPGGSATRVVKSFQDSRTADASCVQYQLGDGQAVANAWNLDALMVPVTGMGS